MVNNFRKKANGGGVSQKSAHAEENKAVNTAVNMGFPAVAVTQLSWYYYYIS